METNLERLAKRSLELRPSDLRLLLQRVHTHTLSPRMSPEEFRETVLALGFETVEDFGDRVGLSRSTIESWSRLGLSRDSAQLLLALLAYRNRVAEAMVDFERCTQIPLDDFFESHRLP